jgi:hypothetical protein
MRASLTVHYTLMEREAAVQADVSVAVSMAGRRSHLELLFCIRKHGLEWRRFEEAFGYVGIDATMPTLQVSVWLDDLFHLYGGQRSARVALDLFDEYGVVDPKRQLGSTSHKRRVEPDGEATPALALVEADTLVFEFGSLIGVNVVTSMRISVPSGSVAWVPTGCPRRLRVHATVCVELRGSPVATAREVWGLRSAAWWASVDLTRDVDWLSPPKKRQMRERAGYELVAYLDVEQ